MIIAFNGRAGSGKDTAAKMIQWLCKPPLTCSLQEWLDATEDYRAVDNWHIKKFADPVRQITSILLGLPLEFTYTDEFKQMVLPPVWNYRKLVMEAHDGGEDIYQMAEMTGRDFLQKLGTEAIRDGLHPDAWMNAVMSGYKCVCNNCRPTECNQMPKWIITDLRFPNEMRAIKERNGITIKIISVREQKMNHYSEIALEGASFDYYIDNSGSMQELLEQLKHILKLEKIN